MATRRPAPDRAAAERAIADLIRALALDPADEPELSRTPARVADYFLEVFAGLDPSSEPRPVTFPSPGGDQLVAARDLPFHSVCVHHLVPFFGRALVAYLPGDRIVGVSALPRLLQHYARRPQLQERLATQVADHLERLLQPRGVAVVLEARHLCMEMRGIRSGGRIETRCLRGALAEAPWTAALGLGRPPRG